MLNVGIIGAGAVADAVHLPGYGARSDVNLRGIASRTRASAEHLALRHGVERVMEIREMLESEDIDAVSICTPPASHRELTEWAVDAGKHVLLEKPVATTFEDLEAIKAGAKKADVTVEIVRNERFMVFNRAVRKLIASEALGELLVIQQTISTSGPEDWSPRAGWFRDRAISGGGALIDLAVHKVDQAVWISDRSVSSVSGCTLHGPPEQVECRGAIEFVLDGGIAAQVFASWEGPPDESTIVAGASHGVLVGVSSMGSINSVVERRVEVERTVPPWGESDSSALDMVSDFLDSCLARRKPVEEDPFWDTGTRVVLESYDMGRQKRCR